MIALVASLTRTFHSEREMSGVVPCDCCLPQAPAKNSAIPRLSAESAPPPVATPAEQQERHRPQTPPPEQLF